MATPDSPNESNSPSNKRDLLAIFLIVVVDVLALTIVIPLLPFYAQSFGATPMDVGMLVSIFAASQFISGPILGGLSDRYGRRPLLILSQIGTLIGFLMLALAQSYWMVVLSRIIDGITAGNLSIAQAYIADVTTQKERTKSFALIGIAFGLGFLIGPAFGGLLSTKGYQAPIYASAALSFLSILATTLFLREPERKSTHSETQERRLSPFHWRAYAPFFGNAELSRSLVQFFLFCMAFSLFTSGFALFSERRLTWNDVPFGPREVGLVFAYSGFLGIFIQGGLVSRLVKAKGEEWLALTGFVAATAGYLTLGFTTGLPLLMLSATISSFGNGVLRPSLSGLISQRSDPGKQGMTLGLSQSLNSLAQIFAPLISGGLIKAGWLTLWALIAGIFTLAGVFLSLKKKRTARSTSLYVILGLFSSLSVTPIGLAQDTPQPLKVRALGEMSTLDWNRAVAHFDGSIIRNLMDGLVVVGPANELTAGLADSWKTQDNGKTYLFTLRKGVQWTDGAPLTASQFAESWKRLLQPSANSHYAYLLFDIEGAEEFHRGKTNNFATVGIKAVDSHHLEVRLKAPRPAWLWNLAIWPTFPIRNDLIQKFGETTWGRAGAIQTLGPYLLESHTVGKSLALRKNPKYYRKQVGNIDRIEILFIHDDSAALTAYENGQLDWIPILASFDAEKLGTHPDIHISPFPRTFHLDFNVKRFPSSSIQFRSAVSQALNRDSFQSFIKKGYRPAYSLSPPGFIGHWSKPVHPFSPTEAKKELEKMGLKSPGKTQTLELATLNLDDYRQMAEFVRAQLQENLGYTVNLHFFDTKDLGSYLLNQSPYHLWILAASAKTPDPDYFYSLFMGSSGNNQTGWKNEQFDQLILRARTETHPIERARIYSNAGQILIGEDRVTVPLYFEARHALIRPQISGWSQNPFHSFSFRDIQWIDQPGATRTFATPAPPTR